MSGRFRKGQGGATRHGSRSSSSDAGAPLAPPVGETRARGRSDEAGPSNVDSMDHDGKHRGGLSGKQRRNATRRSHATLRQALLRSHARARAAALPPDACTGAHVHARTPAQLAAGCAVGQAGDESAAATTANDAPATNAQVPAAQDSPDMPPCARARSTRPPTRPLSAARRCRHGCECQR